MADLPKPPDEAFLPKPPAEAFAPAEGVGSILSRNALKAAGETANLPARAFRLAVGLETPKTVEDYAILTLATAPAIAGGGALAARVAPAALAKVAPIAGRIAASGALSGEQAAVQGKPVLPAAALGAAGAAVGEGAAGVTGKIASKLTGAIEALETIRDRVSKGPDAAVNKAFLDKLIQYWQAAPTESARDAAARYVAAELGKIDKTSGQLFRRYVEKASVHLPGFPAIRGGVPFPAAETARGIESAAGDPATRAILDTAFGEVQPNRIPLGVGTATGALETATDHSPSFGDVTNHAQHLIDR